MTEDSGVRGSDLSDAPEVTDGAITVEVVIPAEPTRLALLRRVAAAVGASLDFDIDTLADLRMAVDQVGTLAVERTVPAGQMTFRMGGSAESVTATASVTTASVDPIDEGGFDWMVLEAIANSLSWAIDVDPIGGSRLTLTVVVRPPRVGV